MGKFDALSGLFRSQLRRNIATGMSAAILSVLVGLASYPIYLHLLGYEKYGIWLALSTVLTFAQLGNFGINPAVTKLVAEAHGAGNTAAVRRCVTTAWLAVTVAGALVFCIVLALRHSLPDIFNVSKSNGRLMADLLPYVALFSVGVFIVESLNAALVGLGRMDLESYIRIFSQAVSLACSAALLTERYGVASLLIGNAFGYLVMHILSLFAVRKILGTRLLTVSRANWGELTRMLRFGGWVSGAAAINLALSPLNRVLLSRYSGVASLPIYEIAYGSAMRVRSLLESGLRAFMPEVSRLSQTLTQNTISRAAAMQRSGLRLIGLLGIPLYGAAILLATPLLHMWLRSEFQPAIPLVFRIMLIGSFMSLLGTPGYYILLGLGEARTCFLTVAILGGSNIAIVFLALLLTGSITVIHVTLGVMGGMGLSTLFVLWSLSRLRPAEIGIPESGAEFSSKISAEGAA